MMTADTMDAAREGEGKNENMEKNQKKCLNLKSKRKCLDPKQPQEQQTAAAQFSSPITRRQSDAGRGSRRVR